MTDHEEQIAALRKLLERATARAEQAERDLDEARDLFVTACVIADEHMEVEGEEHGLRALVHKRHPQRLKSERDLIAELCAAAVADCERAECMHAKTCQRPRACDGARLHALDPAEVEAFVHPRSSGQHAGPERRWVVVHRPTGIARVVDTREAPREGMPPAEREAWLREQLAPVVAAWMRGGGR